MSIFRRFVSAVKGGVWLVRPQGLRHQMEYVERQLDHVHGLFDHWQERFSELFTSFQRQAQSVLPDVVERQQQLGDKLSQLNAGFGAREARITKWLMDLEQNSRQILEALKTQQEQIDQLREALKVHMSASTNHVDPMSSPAQEAQAARECVG